jgi:hypothetical protein
VSSGRRRSSVTSLVSNRRINPDLPSKLRRGPWNADLPPHPCAREAPRVEGRPHGHVRPASLMKSRHAQQQLSLQSRVSDDLSETKSLQKSRGWQPTLTQGVRDRLSTDVFPPRPLRLAAGTGDFSAEQCEHILDIKEFEFRIPRGHTRILSARNNQVIPDRTGRDCVATTEALRHESALQAIFRWTHIGVYHFCHRAILPVPHHLSVTERSYRAPV